MAHQLDVFRSVGISEIGIVTGYKAHAFNTFGLKTFHNADWPSTNMVHSLNLASKWLETGDCLVSYADIYYEREAVSDLLTSVSPLALTSVSNYKQIWESRFRNPFEDLEGFFQSDGLLREIGSDVREWSEINGQYMGLLKFTSKGWLVFRETFEDLDSEAKSNVSVTEVLSALVSRQIIDIGVTDYAGKFVEVDFASDYKWAHRYLG